MPLDLKDPQVRQDLKNIIKEALDEREAERTKRIVAEYEKPNEFGLQDEKGKE